MRSMRTSWVLSAAAAFWMVVFAGSAALAGGHPAAAGSAGGAWRTAHEVRGLAALNAGGDAQVLSVSCASAGNCAAGGYYEDARAFYEAFVVSEVNGAWGRAAEVPGIAALNTGADSWVTSVSCASAGIRRQRSERRMARRRRDPRHRRAQCGRAGQGHFRFVRFAG
jgi:hypothetical protein